MTDTESGGLHRGLANLAPPWTEGQSGNPSGKAKGSFSIRAALKRNLRKGWEEDDAGDGEQIGSLARKLAFDIATAIDEGDADKVRSIATVIDQAEGKPTETRVNKGTGRLVVVMDALDADDDPEALPPGCE